MKPDSLLKRILPLFDYQLIRGAYDTELVVLKENDIDEIDYYIDDRTAFEAFYNHVHVADDIDEAQVEALSQSLPRVGRILLKCLEHDFPDKQFIVFVDIHLHNSAVIRFHQLFDGEKPYYDVNDSVCDPAVRLFAFRSA